MRATKEKKLQFGELDIHTKPKNKGAIKEIMAKLSRGLMLPIAMLPIAGLFLGIGSAIVNPEHSNAVNIFGNVLKMPGDIVFGCLPVLFAIAIAISFTKDSGTAALSAFVGWIVFNAIQSPFITKIDNDTYRFMFYKLNFQQYDNIFTNNVGIQSLSTSVFGGIAIGFIVAFLYNKFKNIQLPTVLGFFSGIRFIPIVTFAASFCLGLIFAVIWPMIGLGIYYLGSYLGKAPLGINSLFFGLIERALVPFGLHHAFYAPLWYTAAGGSISLNSVIGDGVNNITWLQWMQNINVKPPEGITNIAGDQPLWMFVNSIAGHKLPDGTVVTLSNIKNFASGGVNPGQYMQGKYPFMMFGLPAAAAAMIFVVPKGEKRKQAMSVIGSAAITCFLTGITEPLEFTFLFLAPWLFWGIHAPIAGVSFWLMNMFGAHIGMTFSGGLIDFTIYGIVPDATGAQANCYWAIIIGLCLVPIYFFLFYMLVKRFNIKTPGRDSEVKLFTKADFQAQKEVPISNNDTIVPFVNSSDPYHDLAVKVIAAYGGKDNIKNVDACITKLRVQVNDQNKVQRDVIKSLGAAGIFNVGAQSVYSVFGNKADIIKNKMNDILFPN